MKSKEVRYNLFCSCITQSIAKETSATPMKATNDSHPLPRLGVFYAHEKKSKLLAQSHNPYNVGMMV